MDHCRKRIQDAVDDIENNRILKEDAMPGEAGRDIIDNENADDKVDGDGKATQELLCSTSDKIKSGLVFLQYQDA